MRLHNRTFRFVGISALFCSALLTACEDDPILAPQAGGKQTNGSYGNIAIAPPIDSTADAATGAPTHPTNPETF